jgi:ADP-ribosylglycohydrolase
VRDRFGRLTDFVPWRGYVEGPAGTITDDTQLTMVVAETLIASGGAVDVDDLCARLVAWLPVGRGRGRATSEAIHRLQRGRPWWEAGSASAGNGAAMRAAPIGLVHRCRPDRLRRDAALSALPTHRDPVAVAGAISHAFIVAWCLHRTSGADDPCAVVDALTLVLSDVHDPGSLERKPDAREPITLVERLREVPQQLHLAPDDAFDYFFNGAFVIESLPCALWCFLRFSEDPEEMLITAASGGRDSDTVASMAGAYAGAYHGEHAWPRRWLDELEYRDELRQLAENLTNLQ